MLLSLTNVAKIYRQGKREVRALDGVTIEIASLQTIAVTGPSGAGKSTLLHVAGLLDRPSAGSVEFDGRDLYRLSDRERSAVRNRSIGFVFQSYHLLGEFTAVENVMMPGMIRGAAGGRAAGGVRLAAAPPAGRKEIRRRAEELLGSVGLSDRMWHRPGELSGGEAQRVAIARALMNGPELLLCDEPTGNLDSKTGGDVLDVLFLAARSRAAAIVIVTHDASIAARAGRIVCMKDGRIA